jgi:hypothetical protein
MTSASHGSSGQQSNKESTITGSKEIQGALKWVCYPQIANF